MRIGLFGGTFDPPHTGHLLAGMAAVEALALDALVLIPAARQPLKQGVEQTPAQHRLAMVQALAAGVPGWSVDDREVRAGGLSFTVDSVRAWREAHPGAALFLLLGADAAALLPRWREPETIAEWAEVVVLRRGEEPLPSVPIPVRALSTRRVDISATEVRARVRAGKPIRGFVPEAVGAYIAAHGLYR